MRIRLKTQLYILIFMIISASAAIYPMALWLDGRVAGGQSDVQQGLHRIRIADRAHSTFQNSVIAERGFLVVGDEASLARNIVAGTKPGPPDALEAVKHQDEKRKLEAHVAAISEKGRGGLSALADDVAQNLERDFERAFQGAAL